MDAVLPDHVPLWPARTCCELPNVRPLPLVNPHAPWRKRVVACLSKTQYRFTSNYFTYSPGLGAWIFIPRNFVYDMASVPRPLSLLFMPSGVWAYPAGPHDFGYRFAGLFLSLGPGHPYRLLLCGLSARSITIHGQSDRLTGRNR